MIGRLSCVFLIGAFCLTAPENALFAAEVIAHRGYACGDDENTTTSIARAWLAKADAVEIDVRVSADGVAYLFHDDEVNGKAVEGLTYSALAALTKRSPTKLERVLASSNTSGRFILDLKEDEPTKIDAIIDVIAAASNPDRFAFQSESVETLRHIDRRLPGQQRIYLSRLKWRIPYLLASSPKRILKKLEGSGIQAVSLKGRSFLDRRFVKSFQSAGYVVYVWTINKPDRIAHYIDTGADGLITDNVTDARRLGERFSDGSRASE